MNTRAVSGDRPVTECEPEVSMAGGLSETLGMDA